MVVNALMTLAVAAPVGALFGLAYGTSIRIGYEIIFPALFGDKPTEKDVDKTLSKMTTMFTATGGLEAQKFGINTGIKNALKAINADPELTELIKKNYSLDTQNITVNLSGLSDNPLLQETSTPPSLDLSDVPKTRNRAGDTFGGGYARTTAELLAREKRYATGDAECQKEYGSGWTVTGSGKNCVNSSGAFRPLASITSAQIAADNLKIQQEKDFEEAQSKAARESAARQKAREEAFAHTQGAKLSKEIEVLLRRRGEHQDRLNTSTKLWNAALDQHGLRKANAHPAYRSYKLQIDKYTKTTADFTRLINQKVALLNKLTKK